MTERLVIQIDSDAAERARWVPVDQSGRTIGTVQSGPLEDAAGMAQRRQVSVIIPGERVLVTRVSVPPLRGARLDQALAFALEDRVAGDAESLHCAATDRANDGTVAVVAIDRSFMAALSARFAAAGITIETMTPDCLLLPWTQGTTTVVVDDRRAVVRDGVVSGFACDNDLLDELLAARGTAAKLRTLDGDLLPALASRTVEPPIDLLQGAFRPRGRRRLDVGAWRVPAALAAATVLLLGIQWALDYRRLVVEHETLRAETAARFAELVPGEPMSSDPRRQIERRHGSGKAGAGSLLALLAPVAEAVGAAAGVDVAAMSYDGNRLELAVNVRNAEQLDALRARMTQDGRFVASIESASSRGETVEGRLSVRVAGR